MIAGPAARRGRWLAAAAVAAALPGDSLLRALATGGSASAAAAVRTLAPW